MLESYLHRLHILFRVGIEINFILRSHSGFMIRNRSGSNNRNTDKVSNFRLDLEPRGQIQAIKTNSILRSSQFSLSETGLETIPATRLWQAFQKFGSDELLEQIIYYDLAQATRAIPVIRFW